MPRFSHPAIPIVLAAVLIDTIGFGIVMPVLPNLITQLGHVDLEQATRIGGYMLVVFAIGQFFAGPILGNLSDRFGRRPVLLASMLAFGLDYALMAMAPTLGWLFLGRTIAGISGAVYGPASSVIADVTTPEKRSATFGYIGAAFGIGFVIGPGLAGAIVHFGDRAPFVAAAILALTNALVMAIFMPETLAPENRRPFHLRDAHFIGAFRPLFKAGNAAPLLVAWFVWQLAHMVYPATWSFWGAIRFHWGPAQISLSLAFVGLVMAAVQGGLTGRIIARIGERRALVLGLTGAVVSFLAFAFITRTWQAYALFLVSAISGTIFPAMQGLMSRMVDATRQGALQGGIGSMSSVAAIIGPLMLTQALATGVDHGFPGAAFLLAALLAVISLVIIVTRVLGQVAPDAIASVPAES